MNIITIDSADSLRAYITENIFRAPTSKLIEGRGEKFSPTNETNRVWCVEALWGDALNFSDLLGKLIDMELEWREEPWRTELRPSLIN